MNIEFDSAKNEKNIIERGISFELATAKIWPDARQDYGEERFIALGYIGGRLYSMVFTVRGDVLRIISLRKANKREVKGYEQQEA
ncbi:MAG: BrnT family toxin [Methylobacter sp.]|nr:BrnT family toxin [Methylobacter sp.]